MRKIIAILLAACVTAHAETGHKSHKLRLGILIATIVAMDVTAGMDIKSSLDCSGQIGPNGGRIYEGNPLLRSGPDKGFHGKGIALSLLISGGMSAGQLFLYKKDPAVVYAAAPVDLGVAFLHYWAYKHNYGLLDQGKQWKAAHP